MALHRDIREWRFNYIPERCPSCGADRIDEISMKEFQCQKCNIIYVHRIQEDVKNGST